MEGEGATAVGDVFATRYGAVRGHRRVPDMVAILGIPYAAPPFGVDRFREPRAPATWTGIRDGARFGPIAPQSARLPGTPGWSPGDEDVLTVNVWTPALAGERLPVLVWIHGGAHTFGSSAQPDFDGVVLARAGLVVVTANHRLGFEGFGHVPGGASAGLPDNRGLLDQVAALRWVRDNIAGFGGDPDNVTVAGQSSGATAAACLMVMDRARGLFRRVIAHSPAAPIHSRELAAATTAEVAAAAGCRVTAEALTAATPGALVAACDRVVDDYRRNPHSGRRHYDPVIHAPVVDGDVLPADPLTGLADGRARGVDLLVCHTAEEYWLLDAVGSSAKVTTERQLAVFAADFGLSEDLVTAYRAAMPQAPVLDVYLTILGEVMFGEYSRRLAERHARAGGRAFLSRFTRRPSAPGAVPRAWHCADVPFAFGNLDLDEVRFLIGGPPDDADRGLSQRMVRAWAAFAAGGDPGWPHLDDTSRHTHIWDTRDRPHAPVHAPWTDVDFGPLHP
ncbi:carboxylesterase/lipase family protein [Embleya sp. NPDC127516]|uniref:carboxylesterase/lipase family protein n=1 Tax=Embleya sp. NPDC127516 TaxID=3363990 RepID=UPI0037F5E9F2